MAEKSAVGERDGSEEEEFLAEALEKPLKPYQCRGYMRQRLAGAFPKIVAGFLKEAETGSCAHVKLANELLERPAKAARRGKSSAELLLEKFREEGLGNRDNTADAS